ncbi:MAG TPA: HPr-rel-A system PqqD family peptide chaperone [Telluria sp.]
MPHLPSWHIVPGQRLQYRQWDQEAVLFNDLSGDTHLLDADALALLLAVQAGASDLAALRTALRADDDPESEDEADAALQALIEQLASISLIEQRP